MATDNCRSLLLNVLRLDADVQPRETMSQTVIAEYAVLYAEGQALPPIVVFQEGSEYWVADGFHRVEAAKRAGQTEIVATVQCGTKREAVFYACGANKHGVRFSNADKRLVVQRLLEDVEWSTLSDREIARHCGVSHPTVTKMRQDLSGKIYQMDRMVRRGEQRYTLHRPAGNSRSPATSQTGEPAAPPAFQLRADPPPVPKGKTPPTFNRTNEQVDWAWWTWNPVTGCLHNCVYCYARDIANRYYPEKFAPTFHPERLVAPQYTKRPAEAETHIGARNVFVCSMADLFGKWVPDEWIDAVLGAVREAPQWNFLFLTKFPQRLESIDWPQNAWVGTTVDEQYRVAIAEKAFRTVNAPVKWLSCEPLRERLTFASLTMFDWVVLGGQSKSTQAPAFQPPWEWVEHLWQQARAAGCLVYWKPNLHTRPQEYPGQDARVH